MQLSGPGTSARSTDFDLWDSTEEPATTIKDDENGGHDYDDSANVASDGAVRRRRGTRRSCGEEVLNDEGTPDEAAITTCSGCGGILVCLKCRMGGGSVDSKDATAGGRAADSCDTFHTATSGLRDGTASNTHQWATTPKKYRDSGQTFDGTRAAGVEESGPTYRGIDANFVLEMKIFITEAAERLVSAKTGPDYATDPNDKFEERRTIQELEIDKNSATTSPILTNQSESCIENVLCNNCDTISSCTSKSSRKAKRRKWKTFDGRTRTLSTSSAEDASKPDPPAIASRFPHNAAKVSVDSLTRRKAPLKFSKGSESLSDIGDPPSDAAPHSTTGDDGKLSAALPSGAPYGQTEQRQDESDSNALDQVSGRELLPNYHWRMFAVCATVFSLVCLIVFCSNGIFDDGFY